MAFLKSIWKANSKHHKLSEELALQNAKEAETEQNDEVIENEDDVVTFKLKYLGSTVVEKLSGDSINTESVKNIIKVAKASRKKFQRVNIAVSVKGIAVSDLQGNDLFKISIYRISNCSTDPTHRQVFSFVSTDENETMECHAFICSKRKMTETVTLAVAKAFSAAYEHWRILPTSQQFQKKMVEEEPAPVIIMKENEQNNINNEKIIPNSSQNHEIIAEEKLIDFDDEPEIFDQSCNFNQWVCFDDDFVMETQRNTFKNDLILA